MRITVGTRAYTATVMNMKYGRSVAAAAFFAAAALFHAQVCSSMLAAGERCLTVLVPSLYLYSIIAAVCTRSGVLHTGGKACVAVVVVMSQLGGYPLGAQLVHGLYRSESITQPEAKRMLCVCMGCGPGFLFGTVCRGLPGRAALWMLLSVSLPNLLCAAVLLRKIEPKMQETAYLRGTQLLTGSVEAAAGAMLRICGMVLAMAGCMAVAEGLGLFALPARLHPDAPAFLRALLEVTCLADWQGPLPMAAALLTFGGICVHMQMASVSGGLLPWARFWAVRVLCSGMAYALCSFGMPYLCREVQQAALVGGGMPIQREAHWLPGACLLVMSVMVIHRGEEVRRGMACRRSRSAHSRKPPARTGG
ncbi:MAG: hypothetical protein K5695_04050 [Oscillospiraceae bacterium]|nr:hypothetical protein [Oscillospiraceae bacterium]